MGASRLPGKTMLEVYDGTPLLGCVVRAFAPAAPSKT